MGVIFCYFGIVKLATTEGGEPSLRNARPGVVVEFIETTTQGCAQIILYFLKSCECFYHQNNCKNEDNQICDQLCVEHSTYSKTTKMWQNHNEWQEENKLSCEGEN